MNWLRTTTWPGPGSGTSAVTRRNVSAVGQPWGRAARWISRLVVTVRSLPGQRIRSDDLQVDLDVATGRVRVRADLVRRVDELLGLLRLDPGQAHRQGHLDAEPAAFDRAEADRRGDLGTLHSGLHAPRDQSQRVVEA